MWARRRARGHPATVVPELGARRAGAIRRRADHALPALVVNALPVSELHLSRTAIREGAVRPVARTALRLRRQLRPVVGALRELAEHFRAVGTRLLERTLLRPCLRPGICTCRSRSACRAGSNWGTCQSCRWGTSPARPAGDGTCRSRSACRAGSNWGTCHSCRSGTSAARPAGDGTCRSRSAYRAGSNWGTCRRVGRPCTLSASPWPARGRRRARTSCPSDSSWAAATGQLRGHSVSSVPFDVLEPPVKRLQTPSSNRVSLGQQLGGVPTGRGGSQTAGGGGAVAGRRQTVPSKRVPCGQQLGGVPTGRLSGHTGFEADGLVPPLPVSQARPFQNFPAGQAHTPSASRIMPPVHSGGLGAVGGVADRDGSAGDMNLAPSLRPQAAWSRLRSPRWCSW